MKKNLFLLILLTLSLLSKAADTLTYRIIEAGIKIDLPNNKWSLDERKEVNGLIIYIFSRESMRDSLNHEIIPTISVVVENLPEEIDVINYSIVKRSNMPFKVEEVFNKGDKMDLENAVGYRGTYLDNQKEHTIYIVHTINEKKGIQFIFDCTTSIFNQINNEFLKTLKSIRKL